MSAGLACVLLAAGFGRRYGGNKLLERVDGTPLFLRAMEAVPSALFCRAAVVSQYGEILKQGAELGYLAVGNPVAAEGIAASVRLGLAAVMPEADGVLFAVCDQPFLRRESVEGLICLWRTDPEKIAALASGGRRGNPVIFPRALFAELLALKGDVGGSAVIRRHEGRVVTREVAGEELGDVDRRSAALS